jgi:hypothetical protein
MKRLRSLVLSGFLAACTNTASGTSSDKLSDGGTPPPGDTPSETPLPDGGVVKKDALYSVGSIVQGPTSRTLYVQTIKTLDKDLTNESAMEVSGNSRHWAYGGSVYIGMAEEPTVIKYTPDAAGKLQEVARVSFQAYGLANIPAGIAFVDKNKAYLMAEAQYSVVVWDPTTMEIKSSIDLTALKRANYNVELWSATVGADKVYVPLRYVNFTAGDIAKQVGVVILDTKTDTVTATLNDERCHGASQPAITDDGTVYVLADGRSYTAQVYARSASKPIPKNCVLRILPGQTTFDPSYFVEVPSIAGGKDVATALWYVSGGVGYAKMFYEDQVKPEMNTTGFAFWSNPIFKLWKFSLGSPLEAREVQGAPFSYVAFGGATIDGRLYIGEASDNGGSSTVYELDPTTTQAVVKFKMQGFMRDLYRLK